ncbi:hypothetical protein ACGFYQ_33240 [Streptomyces sp. NPDC048258]|uniref:hypothetical protein n=1 Tax=Streptomyces sp. NPDC048258 TaxID=3365527 RepID=UPI00371F6116
MRTALRTSIVTAALAGMFLAPAATAFAAPAAQTVTPVSAMSANTSGDDRYDGEVVLVGPGRIAVLRNKSEGPEVWIRAAAEGWKPGDGWAGRVLAKLDLSNRVAVVDGTEYKLTDEGRYGLAVHRQGEGAADFYLLPESTPTTTPSTKPSAKPSAQPSAKSSAKPSAKPTVAPTTDMKPQTVVVPKGAVAAGAEIPVATAEATADDNTTTVAAGAGLVAIIGALGAGILLRRRRAQG